jgi:hypothetical protein
MSSEGACPGSRRLKSSPEEKADPGESFFWKRVHVWEVGRLLTGKVMTVRSTIPASTCLWMLMSPPVPS